MDGHPWQLHDNLEIIRFCIGTFGAERAMFASNFPVDGLCGSFDTIYSGFQSAVKDDPLPVQEALFFGTAAKLYSVDV